MQQHIFLLVTICGQRAWTLSFLARLAQLDLVEALDENGKPLEIPISEICRDERCSRDSIHARHDVAAKRHRRRQEQLADTTAIGLTESVRKAVAGTNWPKLFAEIYEEVCADYGHTTTRTVHRHIARLVAEGVILRLEFDDLLHDAYVYSKSRFRHDRENLRDHLLGKISQGQRRSVA